MSFVIGNWFVSFMNRSSNKEHQNGSSLRICSRSQPMSFFTFWSNLFFVEENGDMDVSLFCSWLWKKFLSKEYLTNGLLLFIDQHWTYQGKFFKDRIKKKTKERNSLFKAQIKLDLVFFQKKFYAKNFLSRRYSIRFSFRKKPPMVKGFLSRFLIDLNNWKWLCLMLIFIVTCSNEEKRSLTSTYIISLFFEKLQMKLCCFRSDEHTTSHFNKK